MNRIISILMIAIVVVLMFSCCTKDRSNEEVTTTVLKTISETVSETSLEEITTTQPMTHAESGEIIIDDGEYRYKINKTDFEKHFDEELLLNISEIIPMEFGYEDYDKWDASANIILNDVILGTHSRFDCRLERYDFESEQEKTAKAEMMSYNETIKLHEYFVTEISNINEYLIKLFGPDAGVIDKDDFEKYSVFANSEKHPFEDFNYKYNYRFFYLPESELVVCGVNEFLNEEHRMPYICDVQKKGSLYIVRAVSGTEGISLGDYSFLGKQNDALENLGWYTDGWLEEWIYTIACDVNGNMYIESTEISYILPENAEKNYYAVSDAEIKDSRYSSDELTVIDTLSKNEKVYSPGTDFEGRIVVTKEYVGIVEEELLKEIE